MEENSTEPNNEPEQEVEKPASTETNDPKPADPGDMSTLDIEPDDEEEPVKPRDLIPKSAGWRSKKPSKKVVIILLILIAVTAIAGGTFIFLDKKSSNKSQTQTTANTSGTNNESAEQTKTSATKSYKNDTIKIELSYLNSWALKEDVDKVVLTSPKISYTKKDGTTAKNSFRVIVQKGINQIDSNTINNAVAVKISELIKYTAPAKDQRTESYLSFLGKTKDAFKFFLISSGKEYQVDEKVSGSLPLGQDSYIVAGGYGTSADDNFGFDEIAVDKIDQDDAYNQAVDIVKSLKLY